MQRCAVRLERMEAGGAGAEGAAEGAAEALGGLRLECVEEGWAERVHQAEFLESCAPPDVWLRQGVRLRPALAANVAALGRARGLTWSALSGAVRYRELLALLFYVMEEGARAASGAADGPEGPEVTEARAAGVLASRLYCRLLALPGYRAYRIYHPQLLAASLACLAVPRALARRAAAALHRDLHRYLLDLRTVVAELRLAPDDVAYEDLLGRLLDAVGATLTNTRNYDQLELNNISGVCFEIIHLLLAGRDDEPSASAIKLLFKCLLPKLIEVSMDSKMANNVVRAAYVTYSGLLLARYGAAALPGFIILLQHLCFKLDGLERAEVRLSRVSLVTGLMTLLPKKSFKQFVKWLIQLTTANKAPHRHLALEIAAKLLHNQEEEEAEQPPAPIVPPPAPIGQPINSTEKSAEEQSTSSEGLTLSEQPSDSLDTPQASTEQSGEITTETENPDDNDESQSSQDTVIIEELPEEKEEEKDNMPLLTVQVLTVPHYSVLKAVFERANDVSSTVRMRALNILMQCVQSDQPAVLKAIKRVNGDGEQPLLISLAVKCMGDERAVVRKSAVSLVDMLLRHDHNLLTKTNLGVMVSLCRDTSIMVRTAAITALGELMLKWPRDSTFDAFLAGPMHQLSDPEVKVQELIIEMVQKVLFDKLKCYNNFGEEAPWLFLSALTRHNMRRHLQKTCSLLLKTNKCISVRLVDVISTHVGTNLDNDLNSMVLLSCVARHVEYHNIDFVLNYYYELSQDLQGRDARLLPLVLEILTDWAQYLVGEKRSTLRTHLIDGLKEGSWGCEGSRRACAGLAAHLDPQHIGWASDLLYACEQRALGGAPISEWVCAADMTLVASEPPSPRLVQLFISTAAHFDQPHHELSVSARGCVVAGLGRMCVRSRAVAAAAAPALCRLLVAPHAAICVRVNALLALSDICTRYTCIVEPLLGDICSCLEDSPQQLRRASARAITRLLLGGFLRLRAPLYYKYCALLADSDSEVREPAEFYVTGCLPVDTIYHHFVELIMYYNGCSAHSVHQSEETSRNSNDSSPQDSQNHSESTPERTEQGRDSAIEDIPDLLNENCFDRIVECTPEKTPESEGSNVAESGTNVSQDSLLNSTPRNVNETQDTPKSRVEETEKSKKAEYLRFDCRQLIYDIMLQRMSLVQRFNIQCRLASEVLVHAAQLCDENELNAAMESALMDTITLLRSPHMRLPRQPQTAEAADIEDLTARVTSNIVSQKMKRTVAEVLVPAVIRLYARLRPHGGQLVAYVVRLATDLLNDYRQEIEELIDNDEELMQHVTQFQENIGTEPSFSNRLNIVLREAPDVESTPYMKGGRKRKAGHSRLGRPSPKRVLRM